MKSIYNKLMGLIFGPSTPAQLLLVSIFGFIFGFIPGFTYAPFLFVLTIFLVLILRVNIGLFVVIAFFAKVLSFPLEYISFTLGHWLLDEFTQPLFKAIVNTPVLAYAGFDYYLVAGAFVLSLMLGVTFGIFIAKSYKKFVDKMVGVQAGSEIYQKLTGKLTVKIGSRIIFGKNIAKVDWGKIQARKFRQPIRIWGLIVVVILVLAISFAPNILETAVVSNIIKQQLTKINGATVDYDSISLSLGDAELKINGLGAADPENLNKDRFYAKGVSASIDIRELLNKQITLRNVVIDGVSLEHPRYSKGVQQVSESRAPIVTSKVPATKATDEIKEINVGESLKQTVDVAKKMKQTVGVGESLKQKIYAEKGLKQVADILSNFKLTKMDKNNNSVAKEVSTKAKVYGYANVRNESLRNQAPNFAIANIDIKGFKRGGVVYDTIITNLSTNPALLAKPTDIHIQSVNNKNVDFNLVMSNQEGVDNIVKFYLGNLNGDFFTGLTIQNVGIDADRVNVSGAGTWNFSGIKNIAFNIPLQLKLNDVEISLPSKMKRKVSDLKLKATLSGDLNNVDFGIETSDLKDILSADAIKNLASDMVKQTGLNNNAKDLINKTTINGKAIKDLNTKDVKDLASKFGVKF